MSSQQIRHVLSLTPEERESFIQSFDCAICDCDGVLWTVFEAIPGIADALAALRARGKMIRYITNNGVRSFENYATQFRSLGVSLEPSDIIHPALSVVRHLRSINFQGLIYCIATETFKTVLRDAGFELLDGPHDPLEESFKKIVATINDHAPVRAVVIDTDFNVNYPKLLRAELYLKNDPDCLLIAGATDKLLHAKRNFIIIGPGFFLDILEQSTNKEAITLGKPGTPLAEQVLEQYGIADPHRILFIGDMPEQDMLFATRCGFQKLLVLSGGTNLEDMLKLADPDYIPDYYADSLTDLVKLLE